MKRLLAICLAAVLLLCTMSFARAEHIWQNGDTGEEVERIQSRLIELQYPRHSITRPKPR